MVDRREHEAETGLRQALRHLRRLQGTVQYTLATAHNDTGGVGNFLLDKQLMTVDNSTSSRFADRVYVSWTRFLFNPITGRYTLNPAVRI